MNLYLRFGFSIFITGLNEQGVLEVNKIHRKVEYALIALKHMKEKPKGELTNVKEICNQYFCSFDATSRVMQKMTKKGLLKSEQGAMGGYSIKKDLKKVNLYELIKTVVGPVNVVKCLHKNQDQCEMKNHCNIILPLTHLNGQMIQFYQKINIDRLLSLEEKSQINKKVLFVNGV